MDKGCKQRIRQSNRSQADATGIDDKSAIEILEDNPAAFAGNADGFDELHQVVTNQHDISAFTGNIGARSHGDTNGRFTECGSIIDTVSEHRHRAAIESLNTGESYLLLDDPTAIRRHTVGPESPTDQSDMIDRLAAHLRSKGLGTNR